MPETAEEDRVAIVTGASSGIGREIARRLAEDGLDVVVADIRREPKQGEVFETDVTEPTDEVIEDETDSEALFVETDVSEEADVAAMVDATVERFGRIDVAVSNAGIFIHGSTPELPLDDWEKTMGVNLTGYFLLVKHAADHLVESDEGRIVAISSINATFGGSGAAYTASKAGIVNMTRQFAVEFSEDDVTANAVLPGMIKTAAQDRAPEEKRQTERERTLLSRIGEPEDVAAAVSFFVSEDAEWVTGADLVVDGGYIAGYR